MMDQLSSTRGRRARKLAAPALLAAAAGLLAVGCGSSNNSGGTTGATTAGSTAGGSAGTAMKGADLSSIPVVTVTVKDSGMSGGEMSHEFDMPSTVPAGLVQIDLMNTGQEPHQVNIARPKSGVTTDQIDAAIKGPNPTAALALVELTGGSNTVAPSGEQKTVSTFEAGTYYFICFVQDEDGSFHFQHGMIKKVTVEASTTSGTGVPQDQADQMKAATVGTIELKDYGVLLPDDFTGHGWYKVTNDGPQPHEAAIVKVNDGKTAADVKEFLIGAESKAGGAGSGSGSGSAPTTMMSTESTAMAGSSTTMMDSSGESTTTAMKKFAADPTTSMMDAPGTSAMGSSGSAPMDTTSSMASAAPFVDMGGIGGLEKGNTAWVFLDLPKGDYVALCYIPATIPDPQNPNLPMFTPHFMHGMFSPFTIS